MASLARALHSALAAARTDTGKSIAPGQTSCCPGANPIPTAAAPTRTAEPIAIQASARVEARPHLAARPSAKTAHAAATTSATARATAPAASSPARALHSAIAAARTDTAAPLLPTAAPAATRIWERAPLQSFSRSEFAARSYHDNDFAPPIDISVFIAIGRHQKFISPSPRKIEHRGLSYRYELRSL